jgi:mannose-1-phosphate guanylyltransferase
MKALLLAAGLGTRLKPLTDIWPKCLMPIKGRPLLEYWLDTLQKLSINDVIVNTHYFSEYVKEFIEQTQFKNRVSITYEDKLLGTAGTIRKNIDFFQNDNVLLVHADNWTSCNFSDFLDYHYNQRPKGTVMTMMTFTCPNPSSCGIVELDDRGVVTKIYEKNKLPPGELANAAIYLLEPEVIKWIVDHPKITDFSTEVLPQFIGKIATWNNKYIHRDIGTFTELINAQKDSTPPLLNKSSNNIWYENVSYNNILGIINNVDAK